MHQGQPRPHPTWFVLDELASLQRLPQLHTAITENRKSNSPVVLGFQGRSQLETRYGHDAEAMLSQPATKIFLRTSEPHAAKWIADTLGDIEIERLRESRSSARGGQQSYGLERQVEPLVMPSEITGLACAASKVGNLVRPLSSRLPKAWFIERPSRRRPRRVGRPPGATPPHRDRGADPSGRTGVWPPVERSFDANSHAPLQPSAAQVRTYHAEEFSNARQTTTPRATRSRSWHGQLARGGLPGDVQEAHVHRLPWRHPITGDPLVAHQTAHHTDARGDRDDDGASRRMDGISAPKSVSLTVIGGDAWPRRIAPGAGPDEWKMSRPIGESSGGRRQVGGRELEHDSAASRRHAAPHCTRTSCSST
jgi:hypothetical protein